eukprot:CAMPEP_0194246872 /NCGR_PEP_ID=MMETSP0158-20130606/15698_1 /TAXON_ID=33649 /ORGANISM="Thalassionema nitzschioides, Strain L26-B" /LENGTH=178 /DNA_ID=CAMNT_0038982873 /DNA_START=256 /DNA_END=789 /DNA_ORIENTATION=+
MGIANQLLFLRCLTFLLFAAINIDGLVTKILHPRTHNNPLYLSRASRKIKALQELANVNNQQSNNLNISLSSNDDDVPPLIDFGNFWRKTTANFTVCDEPADRGPDFKSKGSKGSKYWDMGTYVVRTSNHWSGQHGVGRIVDCTWTIDIVVHDKKQFVTGRCEFKDFRRGSLNHHKKK